VTGAAMRGAAIRTVAARRAAGTFATTLLVGALAAGPPSHAAEPLPRLHLQPGAAVAGMSAGGAMAVQLHVAHSATFSRGAAVIAGVPYDCARGSAIRATTRCMRAVPVAPDEGRSIRVTELRARSGDIDPTVGLARSRVYLFSGTRDAVVRRPVMDALHRYYRRYLLPANILYDSDVAASHAWVSPASDRACDADGEPYVNNCGVDVPGRLLAWLFGGLAPKTEPASMRGQLLEFDQQEFAPGRTPAQHALDDTGWVFVPRQCAAGDACRLLVALHGCRQGRHQVGDAFVRQAGLNEWADANGIVVLYPQATVTSANPNGCWDWWGYGDARYALKSGVQVRALKAMADRLAGRGDTGR
jgi:poly(3-hydroxybutyrate) depolymerase